MKLEGAVRDPLSIVREYLSSSEPQVRKNVCTALAAIGSRESLIDLLKLALVDPDPGVRARAAEEIEQLDLDRRIVCLDLAVEALKDSGRQQAASHLLAQLRDRGTAIQLPRFSFSSRVRLAIRGRAGAACERTSPWRALTAAALGGFVGAAVLLVGLESLDSMANEVQLLLLATTVVSSSLLGVAAARFSRPLRTYLDRRVGSVVEMASVFVGTLLPLLGLAFLFLFFWLQEREVSLYKAGAALLGGTLSASLVAGAVRGGTLIGAATVPWRHWRRPVQTVVGAALGTLVLTALFHGLARLLQARSDLASAEFAAGWWLMLLPVGIGLAAAIAGLDDSLSRGGRVLRLVGSATSLLLIGTLIPLWLWHFPSNGERDVPLLERLGRSEHLEWGPYDELPVSKTFDVRFPQKVIIQVPTARSFPGRQRIGLTVWRGSKLVGEPVTAPNDLTLVIRDPEEYSAEIYDFTGLNSLQELLQARNAFAKTLRSSFFDVATRLAHLDLNPISDGERGFRIKIVLNADPGFALSEQVPILLNEGRLGEAFTAFAGAVALDRTWADSVPILEQICRVGSLRGRAQSVISKCERAAELAPIPFVLDSRGIARTMVRQSEGAISDFKKVSEESNDKKVRQERGQWAKLLEIGKNPLPPERIEKLLQEGKNRKFSEQGTAELVEEGFQNISHDKLGEAMRLFNLAAGNESKLKDEEELWASFCWYGALKGIRKNAATIVQACRQADEVTFSPSPQTILGLGIAHVLAGNRQAAAEALERLLSDEEPLASAPSDLLQLPLWIAALVNGDDPFTPEVIASIERLYPLPDLAKTKVSVIKSLNTSI
jgi:tetratricopeptide (TPR) repeat protein